MSDEEMTIEELSKRAILKAATQLDKEAMDLFYDYCCGSEEYEEKPEILLAAFIRAASSISELIGTIQLPTFNLLFQNQIEHSGSPALQAHPVRPTLKAQATERKLITNAMRYDVMKKDSFCCVLCGATGKDDKLVVDHITPIAKGGKTTRDNLRTLCFSCNSGKSNKIEESED